MEYEEPIASNLTKDIVDELAASVAIQLGYQPGADLYPIVQGLGGEIQIEDILGTDLDTAGSIRVDGEGDFTIFLASHTGPTRDRFTIAHEIGHYFLHYLWRNRDVQVVERMEATRYGSGRVEWEANWFAAGFLMPAPIFREYYAQATGSLSLLAEHFGVSKESARIRAEFLGLSASRDATRVRGEALGL